MILAGPPVVKQAFGVDIDKNDLGGYDQVHRHSGMINLAANSDAEALDTEIASNQAALEAAGHWGVPTLVFDGEPFFGQDRIDMALWRMAQKGLTKREV